MVKAVDVANFFVDLALDMDEEFITNLKVNKLVYLAQAEYLQKFNKVLFEEKIYAWTYGPVINEVYQTFKPCGNSPIRSTFGEYSNEIFESDELDVLIHVALKYMCYTPSALVNITHRENGPWSHAEVSSEISIDVIKKYHYVEDVQHVTDKPVEYEVVGHYNVDDELVLPKELDYDQCS